MQYLKHLWVNVPKEVKKETWKKLRILFILFWLYMKLIQVTDFWTPDFKFSEWTFKSSLDDFDSVGLRIGI